jgi:2-polyprenyl-3-methyl-5-hydroxy-6-metoxy-1,4-benzoquinol methylase
MTMSTIDLEEFQQRFTQHGWTDIPYLRHHFARFVATKQRVLAGWDRKRGNKLLDVGAHWLHQAVLYAIDDFEVTALDLPITLNDPDVRSVAQAHSIRLLPNDDLEHPSALKEIPDDTFDIVLFTEIIEHITFNPVEMWKEIYRVMKPGSRLIVTTPNYYALRGRTWRWRRFLSRFGGGLDVFDILNYRTYAHHWKEYSQRELIYYFCMLSPDFDCVDRAYTKGYELPKSNGATGTLVRKIEQSVPWTRPDLYVAIEIKRKEKGIVIEPHW